MRHSRPAPDAGVLAQERETLRAFWGKTPVETTPRRIREFRASVGGSFPEVPGLFRADLHPDVEARVVRGEEPRSVRLKLSVESFPGVEVILGADVALLD